MTAASASVACSFLLRDCPALGEEVPSLAVTYFPWLTGVFWKACTFLKGKERDLLGGAGEGDWEEKREGVETDLSGKN